MKLVLSEKKNLDKFRDWIGLLKTLNEEMTLVIKKEGIEAKAMDPSHVAMIESTLRAGAFEEYEVEEETQISISLQELHNRLRSLEATEQLDLVYDPERASLRLNIKNLNTNRRRWFRLPLLEPLEEEVPSPKITHSGEVRFILSDLDRAVKDAKFVAEHIKLTMKPENDMPLQFEATGDTGDSAMELEGLNANVEKEATATFTLSYMEEFVNALKPLAELLCFKFSTDMPLEIEIEGAANYDCKLFLAPCIGV